MSRLDVEPKRKLREMGVASLVDTFEVQDDTLTLGMVFEKRVKHAVDDAHMAFTHAKVSWVNVTSASLIITLAEQSLHR